MEPLPLGSGSLESAECLKISFEFGLTRSTAEGVGGFVIVIKLSTMLMAPVMQQKCPTT